jgi:hypothetical protein
VLLAGAHPVKLRIETAVRLPAATVAHLRAKLPSPELFSVMTVCSHAIFVTFVHQTRDRKLNKIRFIAQLVCAFVSNLDNLVRILVEANAPIFAHLTIDLLTDGSRKSVSVLANSVL